MGLSVKQVLHIVVIKQFFKTHKRIFQYIFTVVCFASVNYMNFRLDSTSYVVSDQINKSLPMIENNNQDVDILEYHRKAKDYLPINIKDFCTLISPSVECLDSLNRAIINDSISCSELNHCIDSVLNIVGAFREDSINKFIDKQLLIYTTEIDSMKKSMEGQDSSQLIIKGKYVELAQLEYEYAVEKESLHKYVIENWGGFVKDSLKEEISRLYSLQRFTLCHKQEVEKCRRSIVDTIRTMTNKFHQNRLASVNYMDFVYYSICVSTTVSFGDIVPNNSFSRLLAILELLVCMVLLGCIVDDLKNRLI